MAEADKKIKLVLIAAMSRNRVIGRGGAMPWRIPEDLKFFKRKTLGKPVITGRRTFESCLRGKPLVGRDNILVSRTLETAPEETTLFNTVEAARQYADNLARQKEQDEIYIIGGGEIYARTIDAADEIYLTEIEADIDGDTYFPYFNRDAFDVEEIVKNEMNEFPFTIRRYRRKE